MQKVILYMVCGFAVGYSLMGCAGGGYYAPAGSHYQYQQQIRSQHQQRGMSAGRHNRFVPNATLPHFGGQQMRHGMSAGQ